jgi:uracil-DNA glycosylase
MSSLREKLGDWGEHLFPLIKSSQFEMMVSQIKADKLGGRVRIYPSSKDVFKAFELTPLSDVRVVILGQDPYHNGQATGLAFGVNKPPIPPSLKIIFKELCDQYDHRVSPDEFDFSLESWAEQGVLLLNTSLSVVERKPGSHSTLWEWWTPHVIDLINKHCDNPIFFLWGKHAQKYKSRIQSINVLECSHPAAEAYGHGGFYGNGHFFTADSLLSSPVDWFYNKHKK